MKLNLWPLLIAICLMHTTACTDDNDNLKNIEDDNMSNVSDSEWQQLSQIKILFGHHSVGRNILEGVQELMKANPQINLKIIDSESLNNNCGGYLKHFSVGQNRNPISKTESFKNMLSQQRSEEKPHLDFFKYCYVDINEKTDIKKIFENYKQTIHSLKQDFPEITIMHVTVPLLTTDLKFNLNLWYKRLKSTSYWKSILERFIKISNIFRYQENVSRNEFNQLIIENYTGIDPIFDLAKIEATHSNGSLNTFEHNGEVYLSLIPEYSSDGGHLNEKGRKILAENFLLTLVDISNW